MMNVVAVVLLTQKPKAKKSEWLGDRDLNPDKQIQSLLYCRCTIPLHKREIEFSIGETWCQTFELR